MKIRTRKRKPQRATVEETTPAIAPPVDLDALTAEETELEELRREAKSARRARVKACREDINEFAIFIGHRLNKGKAWIQEELHEGFQSLAEFHAFLILMSHPESGKAIPIDTEIPTPRGWRTMADLEVGDVVFGRDGEPCLVTQATGVQHGRRVFEITFDDDVTVTADADHRWLARDAGKYRDKRRVKEPGVSTTLEMLTRGVCMSDGRARWRIPVAEAVEYPEKDLLVHPYVLGAWLGDGATDCARLSFHRDDHFIWDRCIELEGGDCEPKPDSRNQSVMTGTIGGFTDHSERHRPGTMRKRLGALGVLGGKHIPGDYARGSVEQRRELLAGLLDTDGSVSRGPTGSCSRIELSLSDHTLATDALELIRSLGFKATMNYGTVTLDGKAFDRWRIAFTAREPVFQLPRKLELQQIGGSDRTRWRSIVGIREVDSVPVKCIAVDSPDHTYLMDRSYTVTHNTTQLAIIRTVWELGNNPDLRFAIVSYKADSKGTGSKIAMAIKTLIESSPEVAEVFPDLVPGGKWEESIFTVRRPSFSKDPSVQVVGYKGTITGSRLDRVIIDDLLVLANTITPDERDKFTKWLTGSVLERMSENGRAIFMCNAWHPKDYAHEEAKKAKDDLSIWHVAKVPVEVDGVFSCSFWNEERLAKERLKMSPLELARAYYCRARDDGESPFDIKAIERAFDVEGASYEFVPMIKQADIAGAPVVTGIDLAITTAKKSHRTAFMTGMKWPDDGSRQLLWAMSGRLRAEEIADYVVELDRRYHPIFVVENNAAQRWIINIINLKIERDYFRAKAQGLDPDPVELPVIVPFTTGRNKSHPEFGVEGLAAEVANDMWIFPSDGPTQCIETSKRLRQAMEFYTRGAHTPDELMALWFLREGLRRGLSAGTREDGETDFDRDSQVTIIGDNGPEDPQAPPPPGTPSLGDQIFAV